MEYVILDLEWNVPIYKTDNKCFEILQIAAAKVNDLGENPISTFNAYIKPQRYSLNPHVREMLPSIQKYEQEGISFISAYKAYREWLGADTFQYALWGDWQDVMLLSRECKEYNLPFRRTRVYDVQDNYRKLFGFSTKSSLESAVDALSIEHSHGPFHDALSDVLYTVDVMKRMNKISVDISQKSGFVRIEDVLALRKIVKTDDCRAGVPVMELADILRLNTYDDARTQSQWLHLPNTKTAKCAKCGRQVQKPYKNIRYCPRCGAEMFDKKTGKVIIVEKQKRS